MSDAPKATRSSIAEDSDVVGDALGPQGGNSSKSGAAKPADIAGIATSLASDIAGTAVDQGRNLLESAKGQATSFVGDKKSGAAQSIADLASSLRGSGESFEDRPGIQAFVGSAADGLDQLAGSIRDRSFAEIYADIESFSRRQPVTVAAGAVLAGFLLARFIKSSAEELSDTAAAAERARPRSRSASRA